jgi:putative tricarboxylic transport membrane protein
VRFPAVVGRDGVAGLVCLALATGLLIAARDLPTNPLVPVGPDFYPRIVFVVTALLSVAVVVLDVRARRRRLASAPPVDASASPNHALVALAFSVFGLYVWLLPALGFRLSTLAFMVALQALLDPPHSPRQWGTVAIVAVVTTIGTYAVFEQVLTVLLPRGAWTGF